MVPLYLRVVVRETYIYIKYATLVDTPFWPGYCGLPVEEILTGCAESDTAQVLLLQVSDLAVDTF